MPDGRLLPVPCNLVRCSVCGKRHALAALEMVRRTSQRMGNPEVAVTLTSVDPFRELGKAWSRDVEQTIKALRRRFPGLEYLGFMEWTSGQAATSGGHRRPHMHLLVRGLCAEYSAEAEGLTRRVWSGRTGANQVEVAPLRAAEDGVAYLALHHLKPNQAAPEGWTGRRLRPSRGWWGADPAAMRREAVTLVADRSHLARVKAERRAAIAAYVEQGLDDDLAAELVLGPAEDPVPIPERQGAEVVRLRRAPA